jgi:hypothetical protein
MRAMVDPEVLAGVVVLCVAGVGLLSLRRYLRRRAVWDTLARWHGLTLLPGELVLEGSLEGRPLRVSTAGRHERNRYHGVEVLLRLRKGRETRWTGYYEVTLVRVDVSRELSRRFTLHLEGPESTARDTSGQQDEQIGDAELDATFELHGTTYKIEELLKDEEVREHLQLLVATTRDVSVRNGWLQAEFEGVPPTAEELEGLVLQVLETARSLEAAVHRFHLGRSRRA